MPEFARAVAPLDDAVFPAFRRAEFTNTAARIDDALRSGAAVSDSALLVRARVLLKTDTPGALEFLTRRLDDLDERHRAEATMLLAVAYGRSRDDVVAESMLHSAGTLIRQLGDDGLAEELRYHTAFLRWTQDKTADAEAAAIGLRDARSPGVRVRAKILEALVLTSRRQHRAEAAVSLEALEMALAHDEVELAAVAARNVSTIAREVALPEIRAAVRGVIDRVAWTDDLRDLQFKTLKATAWCCALDGDFLNAFRLLKAATKAAPTDHWRVMAALDRSYLARCLGEPRWAEQELLDAHELASQLDWNRVTDEQQVALALLAELYAEVDASVSVQYLARFRGLAGALDRNLAFAHDGRLRAIADYSAGVVQARLGNRDAAHDLLRSAWQVFQRAEYDWRAGRCARDIYALTGRRVWLDRARQKLETYRDTWLGEGLFQASAAGPLDRLTPAQRRIFESLVAGASTDDIVASSGRSVFTVRNHVKAILAAFNVNSRSALVAEAIRLKIGACRT
jgi:DNA-binding CsgD family transcriptional regulator